MAGPLAIPAAAQQVAKAVSQDLVVIGGQWFHRHTIGKGKNKSEILTPISYELHLNPVSIGLGIVAGAIGLGVAWFAWNGLEIHSGLGNTTQLLPGLKDSEYWSGIADRVRSGKPGSARSLEKIAVSLDAQGIPLESGLTCDELQTLGRSLQPHAARARAVYKEFCLQK